MPARRQSPGSRSRQRHQQQFPASSPPPSRSTSLTRRNHPTTTTTATTLPSAMTLRSSTRKNNRRKQPSDDDENDDDDNQDAGGGDASESSATRHQRCRRSRSRNSRRNRTTRFADEEEAAATAANENDEHENDDDDDNEENTTNNNDTVHTDRARRARRARRRRRSNNRRSSPSDDEDDEIFNDDHHRHHHDDDETNEIPSYCFPATTSTTANTTNTTTTPILIRSRPPTPPPISSSSRSRRGRRLRRRLLRALLISLLAYLFFISVKKLFSLWSSSSPSPASSVLSSIFFTSNQQQEKIVDYISSDRLLGKDVCHHVTSLALLHPLLYSSSLLNFGNNHDELLGAVDFTLHNDSAKFAQLRTSVLQHQQFLSSLLQGLEDFPTVTSSNLYYFYSGAGGNSRAAAGKNSGSDARQQWRISHYRQTLRDLRMRLVDIETTIAMLRAQVRELSGVGGGEHTLLRRKRHTTHSGSSAAPADSTGETVDESQPAASATFGDIPSPELSATPSLHALVNDMTIQSSSKHSTDDEKVFESENNFHHTEKQQNYYEAQHKTSLFALSDDCTKLGLLIDMLAKSMMLDGYVDMLRDIALELDMFREVPATTRRDFASILEGARVMSTYETDNLKCNEEFITVVSSSSSHSSSSIVNYFSDHQEQRKKSVAARLANSVINLFRTPPRTQRNNLITRPRRRARQLGTVNGHENNVVDDDDDASEVTSESQFVSVGKCPELVISPGLLPGQCWAFTNFPGKILIRLASPLFIKAFQLEHLDATLHDTYIDSAPRNVSVFGVSKDLSEQIALGRFVYNAYALHTRQRFNLPAPTVYAWAYVMLQINSNWGNPYFTCVYRLRVFGEPVSQP